MELESEFLGAVISFNTRDNSKAPSCAWKLLAHTASTKISEVITLAVYCNSEGWIELRQEELQDGSSMNEIMLRPQGFPRLADIDGNQTKSTQAFVAMWFDPSMNDVYKNGIAPAIRDAGYEPFRIDKKTHNKKIDDEIIAELRRSRFLVADFTQGTAGARGGVYYEAGFAHGMNIPVIFTCRKDSIGHVHFDTRQYNHIVWETHDDLLTSLSHRISATIGDGPLRSLP